MGAMGEKGIRYLWKTALDIVTDRLIIAYANDNL